MAKREYESVHEFLEDWVNLRPVTFFEICAKVRKARQNCHAELRGLEKRGVLVVESHRFGRRELPLYQLRRKEGKERVKI